MHRQRITHRAAFVAHLAGALALAVCCALALPAVAHTATDTVTVDFDSQATLGNYSDGAQSTFVTDWIEDAFVNGTVFITPQNYGHFHLLYEDPTINCIDLHTGLFGRPDGQGGCIPLADPTAEPRKLASHRKDQVIVIQVLNVDTGLPMPFDLRTVRREDPIAYRFLKSNGTFSAWTKKGAGTSDLKIHLTTQVQIRGQWPGTNTAGEYTIDELRIDL